MDELKLVHNYSYKENQPAVICVEDHHREGKTVGSQHHRRISQLMCNRLSGSTRKRILDVDIFFNKLLFCFKEKIFFPFKHRS